MTWVLILAVWVAVAAVTALVVGRTVHTADVIEHTEAWPAGPFGARADGADPADASGPLPRGALVEH